jgi:hypothetical protein
MNRKENLEELDIYVYGRTYGNIAVDIRERGEDDLYWLNLIQDGVQW